MPRTRPPHPEEFRREAVAVVHPDRSSSEVAEATGVSQPSLRNWVKQTQLDRHERDDGLTSAEREELRRLPRERAFEAGAQSAQTSRGVLCRGDRSR